MTNDIAIRPATTDDAQRISELITTLAREHIACDLSPEGSERLLNSLSADSIRSFINSRFRYFVAETGGTIAGVVATRDDQHLYHLFVDNQFQRQGLAARLWRVAHAACVAARGTREFTVNSSRNAVAVYERFGFVRHGETQNVGGVVFVPMKLSAPSGD
jgi:ribosomal protein S18 acetylase RimI-like enzyme